MKFYVLTVYSGVTPELAGPWSTLSEMEKAKSEIESHLNLDYHSVFVAIVNEDGTLEVE